MYPSLSRAVIAGLVVLTWGAVPIGVPGGVEVATAQAQEPVDRRFLRMMSDHHEGLEQMGLQAAERAQDPQVRALAQRLAQKQARGQEEMLRMLREHYGETHQPMVIPENRVQMEQLSRYQGTEYDREFLELTIHRSITTTTAS